jgi:hypothetical protein
MLLKALIAFSYPSSLAHPSIRQKECKPFSLSRSKKPQKEDGVSSGTPKVVRVNFGKKVFMPLQ